MNEDDASRLKEREESKRSRVMQPLSWEQIEEMLTWAEAQLRPEERRNRPRTHRANGNAAP